MGITINKKAVKKNKTRAPKKSVAPKKTTPKKKVAKKKAAPKATNESNNTNTQPSQPEKKGNNPFLSAINKPLPRNLRPLFFSGR